MTLSMGMSCQDQEMFLFKSLNASSDAAVDNQNYQQFLEFPVLQAQ